MLPLARESELPVAVATEACGLPTAEERTGVGHPWAHFSRASS